MYDSQYEYLKRVWEPEVLKELTTCEDAALQNLLSSKTVANLTILREAAVESQLGSREDQLGGLDNYRKEFSDLECVALTTQHQSKNALIAHYTQCIEMTKAKRLSVDFDANSRSESPDNMESVEKRAPSISKEDESLGELRNRLLGKRRGSSFSGSDENATSEKQMQVHDNLQQELLKDMSQLVSGLRSGAEAFQNALEEDSTVLKAAELGLQATSRSLTSLGGKLKKYHNSKVGLLFYLGCILFMFLSLLLTYMIVKIFPKM